jgi:hypothetical protein
MNKGNRIFGLAAIAGETEAASAAVAQHALELNRPAAAA